MENEDLHNAMLELSVALGNPALDIPVGSSMEAVLVREATRRILQMRRVPWQEVRTIATMPNARLTPTVVLARSLEKAQHGKIRSVWVGIHWADRDEFSYDQSSMQLRDLNMHKLVLDRRLTRVAFGDDESNETLTPAS